MKQSLSVIIDSTCNFQEVLDQGAACVSQHNYTYWYIECRVDDIDLLDKRLRARDPMMSQRTGVNRPPPAAAAAGAAGAQLDARGAGGDEDGRALFRRWIQHPCRPQDNVIIVDSTADLEVLCHQILEQIADHLTFYPSF
ncbi:hypothetical protein HC256_002075 [Beauveria bassiana]|nr:hypothetical protein HC256_002075 [Beauveria bassiana]